ncbi:esterase-like activity of phytase family protein [Tellurirhabdus bombi]|uniref:esterase-like activity of phytase family protein n=1 Tax=Tellurirhabdus bombi TaxID=2907205 RepID=UPI001F22002E|nr:esterase-like activity of phytase family protein [Tellurirhabdus bombi]
MKKPLLLTFFFFAFTSAYCQQIRFKLKDYLTFPHSRNIHGISGMEFIPERQEWHLAGDRGQYHVFRQLHQPSDWACQSDSVSRTGLYLEAVRYDAATDMYYFAVENDSTSYVGYRKHAMPQPGEAFDRLSLSHSMPAPSTNKGIEALAITPTYFWVAPEAGSVEEATTENTLVHFYRYRKVGDKLVFDAEFAYDIDRNVCPGEALGGISEIIAVPGDETRLLVLERCFQNPTVTVKLYEARVDEQARKLIKIKDKPAFDFNSLTGFRPDNLESMTWGEDSDGKKVLVLMSDDNNSKGQWTQVLWLEMQND